MRKLLVLVGACLVLLIATMAWWWAIRAPGRDVAPRAKAAPQPTEASTELEELEVVPADEGQRDAIVAPTEENVILRHSAAEFDDSEAATLLVQVRAEVTGKPIQGVRIVLWPVPRKGMSFVVSGETSSERFGRSPVSDTEGRARIEVPAGRVFQLNASSDVAKPATLEIPALAVGEQREVEVLLSMDTDLRFVARVVDDESGAALADARARIGPISELRPGDARTSGRVSSSTEELSSIPVDQDGYFEIDVMSWKSLVVQIDAPGYAWQPLLPSAGHESRSTAREIRLRRAAVVEVQIVARGPMALEGIQVELSAEYYELGQLHSMGQFVFSSDKARWSAHTDALGRCRIESLPPDVSLDASAHPRGENAVILPGQLTLGAGETRAIEIELGGGATVTGWLLDGDGTAVPEAEIWLMARSDGSERCLRRHERDSAKITRTDREGRFAYEQVPDGVWLVGCEPEGPFAPETAVVVVAAGLADSEPRLTADGSLYIRGRVLGPDDQPVEAHVFAMGREFGCYASGNCSSDGTFSLGPLVRGSYTLSAMFMGEIEGSPLTGSEPVQAEAGASDVILKLRQGGSISGRVVDPLTGRGVEADVVAAIYGNPEKDGGIWMLSSSADGSFRIDGLSVGTYSLTASTTGVQVAIRSGVQLGVGQEVVDQVLSLEPGGRLRIRYDGVAPYGQVRIRSDGFPVAADGIERGSDDTFIVPVGTLTVECSEYMGNSRTSRTRSVEVTAGGLATVEFAREE